MTYIDPSKAIIAQMIAFDKECIYTHLVSDPPLSALTPAEFETYFDDQTQCRLGMSASEFRERAKAGTLPDTPMVAHLLILAGEAA